MCGIFGIVTNGDETIKSKVREIFTDMMNLSATRGREAAGLALSHAENIHIYKAPIAAQQLTRSSEFRAIFTPLTESPEGTVALVGHSRLVTNGTEDDFNNNQPVVSNGVLGIHNGIVVNDEEIWAAHPTFERNAQVDTEVIMALVAHHLQQTNSITDAIRCSYESIKGAASVALLFQKINKMAIATNTGSLYFYYNPTLKIFIFTSERYITNQLLKCWSMLAHPGAEVIHIKPNTGVVIDLATIEVEPFGFADPNLNGQIDYRPEEWQLTVQAHPTPAKSQPKLKTLANMEKVAIPQRFYDTYERNRETIAGLRRCKRCILPETMPMISFDDEGICNYCREYEYTLPLGTDKLEETVGQHRRNDGRPDCLVMLSGGRDSSYGLHYIKRELGMNPVAFTYDWGMVTDIARRNASRICAELGVEQILLSADIQRKRKNIRENIHAWIKRPQLGMVPLFMAGDKQFFYYANQIRKQLDVDLVFYLTNRRLEKTLFKSGFSGVYESTNDAGTYYVNLHKKLKLLWYNIKEIALNPRYINSTVWDTLFGFYSAYFSNHNMLQLYRYIVWDEEVIENTLISEYDWEFDAETSTTWRIGDGTAAFYNYIYYTIAGFSENDTFLSNQIREGIISRDEALATAEERNAPRFNNIHGYCEIVGIDFANIIDQINAIPKLYPIQ